MPRRPHQVKGPARELCLGKHAAKGGVYRYPSLARSVNSVIRPALLAENLHELGTPAPRSSRDTQ